MFLPVSIGEIGKIAFNGCAHRSVLLDDGVPFAQGLLLLVVCSDTLSLAKRSEDDRSNEIRREGDKTFSA